jgi:hypothetical protein
MSHEIDAIRALLTSKPRPVGWADRPSHTTVTHAAARRQENQL